MFIKNFKKNGLKQLQKAPKIGKRKSTIDLKWANMVDFCGVIRSLKIVKNGLKMLKTLKLCPHDL